jgi:hypothetical protein
MPRNRAEKKSSLIWEMSKPMLLVLRLASTRAAELGR